MSGAGLNGSNLTLTVRQAITNKHCLPQAPSTCQCPSRPKDNSEIKATEQWERKRQTAQPMAQRYVGGYAPVLKRPQRLGLNTHQAGHTQPT